MLAVVLDLRLQVGVLVLFLLLGVHYWNLDLELIVLELEINRVHVLHFEILAHWHLLKNFELKQRNQMGLDIGLVDLHAFKDLMEAQLLVVVEQHHQAHLVSAHTEVVALGAIVADTSFDLGVALVELPVELTA